MTLLSASMTSSTVTIEIEGSPLASTRIDDRADLRLHPRPDRRALRDLEGRRLDRLAADARAARCRLDPRLDAHALAGTSRVAPLPGRHAGRARAASRGAGRRRDPPRRRVPGP